MTTQEVLFMQALTEVPQEIAEFYNMDRQRTVADLISLVHREMHLGFIGLRSALSTRQTIVESMMFLSKWIELNAAAEGV